MKANNLILIAEDDPDIIEVLSLYLRNAGYDIVTADNGEDALAIVESRSIDLCLIDIMMPKMNGYELIKRVRLNYRMPIIVLSAKNQDSDKIIGLELGADDYITKPFNPLEVVARVKSNLRRYYDFNGEAAPADDSCIVVGDFELDLHCYTLKKSGENIVLTPTEFKILKLLMQTPGRVYTKAQIFEYVNGEYYESDENSLMVHMSNLRDKIEEDSKNPTFIKTVRGLGYKFERQS